MLAQALDDVGEELGGDDGLLGRPALGLGFGFNRVSVGVKVRVRVRVRLALG